MPQDLIHTDAKTEKRRGLARNVSAAVEALQTSLALLAQVRVGSPYLMYFAFQIILMSAYLAANTGAAASLWALLIGGDGDAFGRYPEHLLLMQPVLNRLEMLLDIFVRVVFHAATIVLVQAALQDQALSLRGAFVAATRRYPALLLISIVSSAAVFAAVSAGRIVSLAVPGAARHIASLGGIAAALVIQALFVYAAPYVVIGGRSFVRSVTGGMALSRRLPALTMLIVAVPFILVIPTTFLGLKAELIALQLAPEFMIHLHVASKVMELISLYLITAGATVIFLKRSGRPPAHQGAAGGGRAVPGSQT